MKEIMSAETRLVPLKELQKVYSLSNIWTICLPPDLIFSRVCLSVHGLGEPLPHFGHVQTYSTWISLYRDPTRPGHVQTCSLSSMYGWQADGPHPTGMLSCCVIAH